MNNIGYVIEGCLAIHPNRKNESTKVNFSVRLTGHRSQAVQKILNQLLNYVSRSDIAHAYQTCKQSQRFAPTNNQNWHIECREDNMLFCSSCHQLIPATDRGEIDQQGLIREILSHSYLDS